MGKVYSQGGQEQGVEVLHDLAGNPATAHHIAFKLARHFISDTPPAAVVDNLAAVFTQSGGMLPPVYEALINTPECWDAANTKVKNSYDLIVSAMRLSVKSDDDMMEYCMRSMKFLGNIPFTAESPAGFPDTAQDMLGPEALMRRVEWAQMTSRRFTLAEPAVNLAGKVMGPILGAGSLSAMRSANSEMEASAILLGSPEFQRR